jgi:hypothetical protein
MNRRDQQVEHIAQQFYATLEATQPWISAPEALKEELRSLACMAIKVSAERQAEGSSELIEQPTAANSSLN